MTATALPGGDGRPPVVVVGGGIAGVSCARVLVDAGVPVRIVDRGRRLGGRMAVRHEELDGAVRAVDVGASYFTVRDPRFAAVAEDWRARGLARVWTSRLDVLTVDARTVEGAPGPVAGEPSEGLERWAAADGLRSLVEDLAAGIPVTHGHEVEEVDVAAGLLVDGEPAAAVVLAMPEPQAYDLLPEPVAESLGLGRGLDWSPTVAVWAAWSRRWWDAPDGATGGARDGATGGAFEGAFVDGSPVVSWIADDGRRRGDGAAVLVAHLTGVFAAGCLEDPDTAVAPALAEVAALLGAGGGAAPAPLWARAHRWSLAAPRHPHAAPFALADDHPVGVCGDAWGPRARIEQAWVSGHELGHALVARLSG